ncbi:hypothetical protein VZT92_027502 [Zoarces viviparus]|uniref:Uncharacterized protein n=1 Tax=Zoarces viviparus TaxID=48416 RepID=A0AAW1DUJ3_ZOAVI
MKYPGSRERKPKFVIFYELRDTMNLVKKKGTLSVRGHAVLYVLIGPLVSGASSQAADTPEEEVSSLKLIIVADYPTWQPAAQLQR